MCIIVDADCVHHLLVRSEQGIPVLKWLLQGSNAGLVVGGKNLSEIGATRLRDTLAVLSRAGRLHKVSDAALAPIVTRLRSAGTCRSNDSHVVALALVSRCRLVFSHDEALHADLKSHSRTGEKISIYQDSSHEHLLTPCRCFS